jgi:two-component system, NarL family, nitrate/nitrite response regulator NarL
MSKTKILVVDDHAIVLDGIKSLLAEIENIEIAATVTNANEALTLLKQIKADLVITDINMPGMDGLEFIKTIRRDFPPIKIIVLSLHDEAHFVRNIMKQRVQGYILKNDASSELVEAVHRVLAGKTFFSSKISQVMMEQINSPASENLLSERELEIIRLIVQEKSSKQIADKLFISERTVETHRKNIFRKTATNNIVGLIKFAFANNLTS